METLIFYEKPVRLKSEGLDNANKVFEQLQDLKNLDKEVLVCFCLDTRSKIISREIISIGSLNTSVVHPREIFKPAITRNANTIILAHNHPSGDANPSKEDIEITKVLVEAGKIIGIPILDHVIVGCEGYTSMANARLIEFFDKKE